MARVLNHSHSVSVTKMGDASPLHAPMVVVAVIDAGVAVIEAAAASRLGALASWDTTRTIGAASIKPFGRLIGSLELKVGLIGGRHWRAPC